jgi:hypothetical protein
VELKELCDIFNNKARVAAIKKMLAGTRNRVVSIDGLAGSASSMLLARMPRLGSPYLIVANDLDEAGYIYNDLCQINGEQQVLIFPSGYKRDIKYGQVDAPSAILRTEVLNQWYCNDALRLRGDLPRGACREGGLAPGDRQHHHHAAGGRHRRPHRDQQAAARVWLPRGRLRVRARAIQRARQHPRRV